MTDNRLLSLIDAANALDNPALTLDQAKQVSQLCSILAQSLDAGFLIGEDVSWPSEEQRLAFNLAMKTSTYAESLSWPDDSEWWRDHRAEMLAAWGRARREAELEAHGKVAASTLTAIAAAERAADGTASAVTSDDTLPRFVSRDALPTAWEF